MKNFKNKKIGLIGCGIMGQIFLEVLYKTKFFEKICVIEQDLNKIKNLKKKFSKNVIYSPDLKDAQNCNVIILAIKPQDFRNFSLKLKNNSLVISIMAGISTKEIAKILSTKKIIRAMPNMPAKIKKGVIGYFASKNVSKDEKLFAQKLFSEMGFSFFLSSEKEIDMITAVSGSGPAYIFYIIDCFIKSAYFIGLKGDLAKKIVLETFKGSLVLVNEKTDFSTLIKNVASKGGTTEAALKEFNNSKIDKIWQKAISSAYKRAQELSK
ncbi:MAG: pyrroline-5-carboxylate reductase [Candidatus Paceibacterota bacterium]|jgi:pyrroline-5-carboxylate reductase